MRNLRRRQERVRRAVIRRDGGRCADCGLSCLDFDSQLFEMGKRSPTLAAFYADLLGLTVTCRGAFFNFASVAEVDHVEALTLGGADSPENCRVLCTWHHREKSKRDRAAPFSLDRVDAWDRALEAAR